ncbi:MAG: 30S ribosomal protein S19e [Candidatus Pacearchaeota archaeon]
MAKNSVVYEIPSQKFIIYLAEKLKGMKEFEMPNWAAYVKTGVAKMRPPETDDWWYVRAASILRKVYVKGIVGVERLRNEYGSRKKSGMRPEKFFRAGGKIIRTILQQATKAGLIEHIKEKKVGRRLTKKGKEYLETIAAEMKHIK